MARLIVLLGGFGVAGSAAAGGVKFPRQQPPPPPVTLSARVRPSVAPQGQQQGAAAGMDLDAVLAREAPQSAPRPEQEQILVALIADTPDSEVDEKSDYYFRLAQVYASLHRMWSARSDGAMKAKDYLLKAVKTYKSLTNNDVFRNYPKMDRALFDYAYTLQSGKYMKEAREVYDRLLKNYPSSVYVPAAHFAFGEYYFEQSLLADAEARYKQVLKFPKSAAFWFAMYKLGWIHMAGARHQEALETFFQVAQGTANDAKAEPLHRAAESGFVAAYAEVGKPDKARAAFERVDQARAVEMVGELSQRYATQGKGEGAIAMAREKIKTDPAGKDVCRWEYEIARAMSSPAEQVTEVENLVALRGALAAAKTLPAAEAAECAANAAAMSGELARLRHGEFVTSRDRQTLGYAERLYKAYVTGFTDAPDRDEMRAAYGEVLWSHAELESTPARWAAAAEMFMTVASTAQDPKRRSDAGAAGVLAWKNGLGDDGAADVVDLEAAARAKPAPKDIPAAEDKALGALEAYAATVQDVTSASDAKLLAASRYRHYAHPERAIPLLVSIVEGAPANPRTELAANLLLDSLVRAQQYDVVLQWVDRFANDARFLEGKPALQQSIKFLRSRSLRRR